MNYNIYDKVITRRNYTEIEVEIIGFDGYWYTCQWTDKSGQSYSAQFMDSDLSRKAKK